MSEERDQILAKLRELLQQFQWERSTHAAQFDPTVTGFWQGIEAAWSIACGKLKALVEEIDTDSRIPVEQPLTWHSDYLEYEWAKDDSLSRGMLRKCLQCSKCKAGMEVEVVKGEPVTKKRIQCSCGHVQLASFFQNGQ